MRSKLETFLLTMTLMFLSFSVIKGQCSCGYVTPDSKYVEIVFVGKILNISEEDKLTKYQIKISEIFKGIKPQETIEVFESPSSCNFRRYVNGEFLFMVSKDKETGKLEILGCSHSSENIRKQKQMIEILRWKKNTQNQGGILVGKVVFLFDKEGNSRKPDGVDKVFAENDKGEKFEADIETDGFYKLTNLKKGNYKIQLKLPEGLTTYGDKQGFDRDHPSGQISKFLKITAKSLIFRY